MILRLYDTGDKARLSINLEKSASGGQCTLRFWTHMHGDDVEQLNILSRYKIGGPETQWKTVTARSNEWRLIELNLFMSAPLQVGISALWEMVLELVQALHCS